MTIKSLLEGFRLSPQQLRLWRLHGGQKPFLSLCRVQISGEMSRPALEEALSRVARKHEILRTNFRMLQGMLVPLQVINTAVSCSVEWVDLESSAMGQQDAQIAQLWEKECNRSVSLESDSLLHARCIRLKRGNHVLLFSVPCMVSDGSGMEKLLQELEGEYLNLHKGMAVNSDDREITQYADVSETLNECLDSRELHPAEMVLTENKSGTSDFVSHTEAAEPRPFRFARLPINLEPGLVALVSKALADLKCGWEPFLLTCWQALISRREDLPEEVVMGVFLDGRNHDALLQSIGVFSRYLPISQKTTGHASFREWVANTQAALAQLKRWQHYSHWQHLSGPDNQKQSIPYCTWCFEYRDRPWVEPRGSVSFTLREMLSVEDLFSAKIAFVNEASHQGIALHGELQYVQEALSQVDAEWLLRQFVATMQSCAKALDQPVRKIRSSDEEELFCLRESFSRARREFPSEICVHELFQEQARKTPAAMAIESAGSSLTFAELNRRSNQMARYLQRAGAGPESKIGIYAERSFEMVIGLLGILKAGSAYVPLDPAYPRQRLDFMLSDAHVRLILTQGKFAQRLTVSNTPLVRMDEQWPQIADEPGDDLQSSVHPENLAYVIYTSGSTGKPKGTGISQRALSNHMQWMQEEFGFGAGDRILQRTPFSFDASVWEFYAPLISGGQLVMFDPDAHQDPRHLGETLLTKGITVVQMIPTLLREVMDAVNMRPAQGRLRLVACGGEPLRTDVAKPVWEQCGAEVVNLYGPTEATIDSSFWRGRAWEKNSIPIGRPVANLQTYVLDENLELTPIEASGNLYIGGAGLARGYLGHPAMTAEKFVPNPFVEGAGERLYRTGDRARWRADGQLEFRGRLDEQVKLRGFRIELGEIEAVLRKQAGVRAAVAMVRTDESGSQRLVAHVVAQDAQRPQAAHLLEQLRKSLPDYMVPSALVFLDELPLLPNGKVDRSALPAVQEQSGSRYIAPRTPEQEILCGLFGEVVGIDGVGIDDNFFELGGHSLLATQVISRMRQIFQAELPLQVLFESPTVRQLSQRINERRWSGVNTAAMLLERQKRKERLPLSFAQQRLWFLDQLTPGSTDYSIPFAMRMKGTLDKDALRRSAAEIVRRHEALRTTFPVVHGEPMQAIAPYLELNIEEVDLRRLPKPDRETEMEKLVQVEARRACDLARGPLMRATLLQLDDEEHVLLVTVHHIISDGWSTWIQLREFCQIYEAFTRGDASPLAELKIQYADFALWQRDWLQGAILDEHLSYWRTKLHPLSPLKLPVDTSLRATSQPAASSFTIAESITVLFKTVCRQKEVTLFMALLAAFKILLYYYTRQEDIAVGTNVANRNLPETEGIIGFFINQVVLLSNLSGNPTFAELLGQVRSTVLEAYAHQDLPFEMLVADLQPHRTTALTPLFEVKFEFAPGFGEISALAGMELSVMDLKLHVLRQAMQVFIQQVEPHLAGTLVYDRSLFRANTIDEMLRRYEVILSLVAESPDLKLADIVNLLEENRHLEKLSELRTIKDHERNKLNSIKRKPLRSAAMKGV